MSDTTEVRYCKKCNCELASTSKYKLCDNCRRSRINIIKYSVGGLVASIGSAIALILKGKSGDSK